MTRGRRPARGLAAAAALAAGLGLWWWLGGTGPAGSPEEVAGERAPSAPAEAPLEPAPEAAAPGGVAGAPPAGGDAGLGAARGPTAPPGRLTGRVVDEGGRPVPGAAVRLFPVDPQVVRGGTTPDGPLVAEATTDADGAFALDAPLQRWVRVVATAAGHATAGVLSSGAGTSVVLRLPRAGRLEVEVLDEGGDPVAGAAVEASAGGASVRAATDGAGRAVFDAIAPGAANLRVEAAGFAPAREGPLAVLPGAAASATVVLRAGVALAGRVLDAATGEPVVGAEVHVARPGQAVPAGITGPDGEFGPVAAGALGERSYVAVRREGYRPALETVVLAPVGPAAEDVEVTPQGPRVPPGGVHRVDVRIARAEPWTGRVTDRDGNPVEGAAVAWTADGIVGRAMASTATDAEGRFTIPPPPPSPPGRRVFLLASRGAARAALAAPSTGTAPDPLVLALSAGGTVQGRVVDLEGAPVAGAQVLLGPVLSDREARAAPDPALAALLALNERGLQDLTTATDGAGWWEVAGVPPGEYQVHLDAGGAARWVPDVLRVAEGTTDAGLLTLGKGLRIEGRVVSSDGARRPGARVHLVREGAPRRSVSVVSDEAGEFAFPDLAPGPHLLTASWPGLESATLAIRVERSEEVVLTLPAPARLVVRVREGGRDAEGPAIVTLERADMPAARDLTSAVRVRGGRFVLEPAPVGSWIVEVAGVGGRVGRSGAPAETAAGRSTEVAVDLAPAAALEGRVTGPAGEAVAGALVSIRREGGARRAATTDADGRYRVEGVGPGTVTVRAAAAAGAPDAREVTLGAGERRVVDLALREGGTLEVLVLGADDAPRAGAEVLVGAALLVPGAVPPRTDREGRAVLRHLPAGPVLVRARGPDGAAATARVVLAEGETREVVLTLR